MSALKDILAWGFVLATLAGVVWAMRFLLDETRDAWREWRSEES